MPVIIFAPKQPSNALSEEKEKDPPYFIQDITGLISPFSCHDFLPATDRPKEKIHPLPGIWD